MVYERLYIVISLWKLRAVLNSIKNHTIVWCKLKEGEKREWDRERRKEGKKGREEKEGREEGWEGEGREGKEREGKEKNKSDFSLYIINFRRLSDYHIRMSWYI